MSRLTWVIIAQDCCYIVRCAVVQISPVESWTIIEWSLLPSTVKASQPVWAPSLPHHISLRVLIGQTLLEPFPSAQNTSILVIPVSTTDSTLDTHVSDEDLTLIFLLQFKGVRIWNKTFFVMTLLNQGAYLTKGLQIIKVGWWNHARICSWNQPVLSNEGEVSGSRKQQEHLIGFKLMTDD